MARQRSKNDNYTSRPAPLPRQKSAATWRALIVCALVLSGIILVWRMQSGAATRAAPPVAAGKPVSLAEVAAAVSRARQYERDRDDAGLERELQTLIELQPDEFDWWFNLCRLRVRQGRSADAVTACRAALQRTFPVADASELRVRMADESIKLGNGADARAVLEPLLSQSPPHPWFSPLWAKVLRMEGKSAEALKYLQSAGPANHGDVVVHQLTGILQFDLGQYPAALESLRTAARLDPHSDVTQFKLAECARVLGNRKSEQSYRAEYARLHAVRQEISGLENRYQREQSLSRDDALRLADLHASIGQEQPAMFWRRKAEIQSRL